MPSSLLHWYTKAIDGSDDDCRCKMGSSNLSTPQQYRSVKVEELNTALSASVKNLTENDLLDTVESFDEVVENNNDDDVDDESISLFNCDAPLSIFRSEVEIDMEVNGLSQEDLKILGRSFSDTYNDLSASLCDPLSREIVSLKDVIGTRRQLDDSSSFIAGRFVWRCLVTGRCRGCKTDETLFDDGFARRLSSSFSTASFIKARKLSNASGRQVCPTRRDVCAYPKHPSSKDLCKQILRICIKIPFKNSLTMKLSRIFNRSLL